MAFGDILAAFNAVLNGGSAVLVFSGWRAIRNKDRARHRACMLRALTLSALFLVSYLIRVALTGTHRFAGPDWLRVSYLVILFSHMALAIVVVPLVLRAVYLALRRRYGAHRRIVRFALPIWLYVSTTGVIVYLMLYHLSAR